MKRLLCGVLALVLLTGCSEAGQGAPLESAPVESPPSEQVTPESAVPAPGSPSAPLRAEPLPEAALALLELEAGEYVLDWTAGDLDGDGRDDLAAVVERNGEDPAGERWGRVRELTILLGRGEGYALGQSNRELLLRSGEGGMRPDPYDPIRISEGRLAVNASGGSNGGWSICHTFLWTEDGLILSQVVELVMDGLLGIRSDYDFTTGRYAMWYITEQDGSDAPPLLYQTALDRPQGWTLEDTPGGWSYQSTVSLPPLPYLRQLTPPDPAAAPLIRTPEQVLEQVRAAEFPDWARVDIPWTQETRANYSAAAGYPVPGYYYTDGTSRLYYFQLERQLSDSGAVFYTHQMICTDGDSWRYYEVKDEDGTWQVW